MINQSIAEMISAATESAQARDQEDAHRYGQAIELLMRGAPSLSRSEAAQQLHIALEINDVGGSATLSPYAVAAWKIYHGQP